MPEGRTLKMGGSGLAFSPLLFLAGGENHYHVQQETQAVFFKFFLLICLKPSVLFSSRFIFPSAYGRSSCWVAMGLTLLLSSVAAEAAVEMVVAARSTGSVGNGAASVGAAVCRLLLEDEGGQIWFGL
jgi:hypothetical protein